MMFPRIATICGEARFPAPTDALREIELGHLPANYLGLLEADPESMTTEERVARDALARAFGQEASLGMRFRPLAPGTPIRLEHMHPERRVMALSVPEPPELTISFDGASERVAARLVSVTVLPLDQRAHFVWVGRSAALPRYIVRGIHTELALHATIDGARLAHEPSPLVRQRVPAPDHEAQDA
jgi:hypothetical protein